MERTLGGSSLALSFDEAFALTVLHERYVLSGDEWLDQICESRGRRPDIRTRFPLWVASLLEKRLIEVVGDNHLAELGLPTTTLYFVANDAGGSLVNRGQLLV